MEVFHVGCEGVYHRGSIDHTTAATPQKLGASIAVPKAVFCSALPLSFFLLGSDAQSNLPPPDPIRL